MRPPGREDDDVDRFLEWWQRFLPRPLERPPEQLSADTEEVIEKVEQARQVVNRTADDVKQHTLTMQGRVHDLEERLALYEQVRS